MGSKKTSAEPTPISPDRIAAFRLTRHHLASRAPASDPARVARDMGGAQAQVMSAAQMSPWALGKQSREKAKILVDTSRPTRPALLSPAGHGDRRKALTNRFFDHR
jgi:hypothetical protein